MSESANTFLSILPIIKDSYAPKPTKTHKKPGKPERFNVLKDKLKK